MPPLKGGKTMKTFLAGYFYDWSRGDYYLNTRGITEEEAEAWGWAIDEILNEKNYKTGKWYRIKFDDLPELRRCANCGRLFNVDARRMEFCANIELHWRCDEQGLLENGDEI